MGYRGRIQVLNEAGKEEIMDKTQNQAPSAADINRLGAGMRPWGTTDVLSIDGVEINYWQQGEGPQAVVFIHGNTACKEVFHRQFEHLGDSGLRLIALDLPGHGASANAVQPDRQYTISAYAALVEKLLDAIGVSDPLIVGWSLGGNIALEMAGRGASMKAMMITGAPPVGPGPHNFEAAYLPQTTESAVGTDDASATEIEMFVRACYGSLDPIPGFFFQSAMRTDGRARETMVTHWLSGVEGHDQMETVSAWDKPICVVHGLDEPFVALDYLKAAPWRNLWGGEVFEFAGCGHAPFIENPEAFNALLEKLLSDVT